MLFNLVFALLLLLVLPCKFIARPLLRLGNTLNLLNHNIASSRRLYRSRAVTVDVDRRGSRGLLFDVGYCDHTFSLCFIAHDMWINNLLQFPQ